MIELDLPDLPLADLTLECVDPVRGPEPGDGQEREPLRGRVALGGPESRLVTPAMVAADAELRDYVESESPFHEYHLVRLVVSFAPLPERPRLHSAEVALRLSSTVSTPEPVAVSMTPLRVADATEVAQTVKFGPKLSLLGVDATLGEIDRSSTEKRSESFIVADRLGRADPRWVFRRTRTMRLEGPHTLALVVRSGAGSAVGAECTVTAQTRGNFLRRYELPGTLRSSAVL